MSLSDWLALSFLGLIWGGSFFFVAVAVGELPPLSIVWIRVAVAALALWLWCRATGVRFPGARPAIAAFAIMGILNNAIPFTLIAWGQTQVASGLASILNATTPMFTVMVAHFAIAGEKLTGAKLAGIGLGFAGVAAMFAPALVGSLEGLAAPQSLPAQLAILGAAFSYGLAAVFGRRFAQLGVAPVATATGQLTASSLILAPAWVLIDQPWQIAMPGTETALSVLGLALACTSFAYVLYFRILARAGATNVSLVTFLVPVSAILLRAFFLGEALVLRHYAGMALIFAGLAVIDGRLSLAMRR
jgi:drug/metabolite transporter (DMT)-like permease